MNLAKDLKVTRVQNGVAAGTTDKTSTFVDMSGYDGVVFATAIGAITATGTCTITALQSDSADGSSPETLTGSSKSYTAVTDDNKVVIHDIYRPSKRYVGIKIDLGTANSVIDGVLAIQYSGNAKPATDGSGVLDKITLISPAAS